MQQTLDVSVMGNMTAVPSLAFEVGVYYRIGQNDRPCAVLL